jgi:hypothetical protein
VYSTLITQRIWKTVADLNYPILSLRWFEVANQIPASSRVEVIGLTSMACSHQGWPRARWPSRMASGKIPSL